VMMLLQFIRTEDNKSDINTKKCYN